MVKKIPKKYAFLVTPFLVSCLMTFVVSGVSTIFSIGFESNMISVWIGAWIISWLIAFPTLIITLPMVRRFVSSIVED